MIWILRMFQFHFGSIGSFVDFVFLNWNFAFQFHFGSIGSPLLQVFNFASVSFNSTLVRLEGSFRSLNLRKIEVSIPLWFDWKQLRNPGIEKICFVSIPLWFDWKSFASKSPTIETMFQFHFGSIGSNSQIGQRSTFFVSIPLWFDWKAKTNWNIGRGEEFQFHFGSIGSRVSNSAYSKAPRFQFHFGSIGRPLPSS